MVCRPTRLTGPRLEIGAQEQHLDPQPLGSVCIGVAGIGRAAAELRGCSLQLHQVRPRGRDLPTHELRPGRAEQQQLLIGKGQLWGAAVPGAHARGPTGVQEVPHVGGQDLAGPLDLPALEQVADGPLRVGVLGKPDARGLMGMRLCTTTPLGQLPAQELTEQRVGLVARRSRTGQAADQEPFAEGDKPLGAVRAPRHGVTDLGRHLVQHAAHHQQVPVWGVQRLERWTEQQLEPRPEEPGRRVSAGFGS